MKKLSADQQARLDALSAREAAGETLTAAEAAEKKLFSELSAEDSGEGEGEDGNEDGNEDGEGEGEDGNDGEGEGAGAAANAPGLTIGQRVAALLSGQKTLAAKAAAAEAKAKAALAKLAAAEAARDTALAQVTAMTGERDTLTARVATLEAEAKTTDAAVTDALAGLNIPRKKLPAPAAGGGGDPLTALMAQYEAETDPAKKGALANQIWDARKALASGKMPVLPAAA